MKPVLAHFILPFFVILAVCGTFIVWSGFDGLYGQDPYAYYDYAVGPLTASLQAGEPLPPFHWPPGYPLLVALSSFLVGVRPLAGQLVALLGGAMVALFSGLLAQEIVAKWSSSAEEVAWVPLLAGLLVAFNGQLWQSSVVVMSDTAGLAMAALGVWALARYGRVGRPAALWLAAGALAYAVIVRWVYWLVVIPAGIYTLTLFRQQPLKKSLGHGLGAAVVATLILGPVMGPVLNSWLVARHSDVTYAADWMVLENWQPLTFFRRQHLTDDGLLSYKLPNGLYYALAPARTIFLSPLLALFIPAGLWQIWRQKERGPALWLLVGWAGVVYLFLANIAWQNFRFTLAFLPPLAILAAIGLSMAADRRPKWLLGLFVVAFGIMAYSGWQLTQGFVERKNSDLATVAWVTEQLPAGANLLTFSITLTFQHYSDLSTEDIFGLTTTDLSGRVATTTPLYLFLNLNNIEGQWLGLAPSENYHWLADNPGLTLIDQYPPYTLFKVNQP